MLLTIVYDHVLDFVFLLILLWSLINNALLQIFERVILPTHNTHHVQYIIWYICSLRPKLAEVYVKYLWTQVLGVHVPPVTRQSAAAYVASFLARANFVRIEYVS